MTHPQDDRAPLSFILGFYGAIVVLAYIVFKQAMIMVTISALNSGTDIALLKWLPDLIFALVAMLGGAAYVFAYRRQTARLAQTVAADS